MAVALLVRLWIVATHTYVVFPDETFQYLEPAHRLAFGSGVITWEFIDGIRSWFLPGLIAGVMWLVARIDPEPSAYVHMVRGLCALASLAVPFVSYRLAMRRYGLLPALLAGLLAALASETVYFAPVIMTEPLATDAALLAIWLGDETRAPARARLLLAGVLFGVAATLRYQYAPVLGLAALLQHARRPRRLALVVVGGLAVVLPVLGGLDALTWGAPFQSVWLNYLRNATQGVSAAMGTQAWSYYPSYYLAAWGLAAAGLLACAVIGGVQVPVLGVVVLATIGLHSLVAHKELRFVFLATACMPALVGIGLGCLLQRMPRLRAAAWGAPSAVVLALAISSYTALTTYRHATLPDAWHRQRSLLQATAAARGYPAACGLAIRSPWVYLTGGYTYWDRSIPIYFETWEDAQIALQTALHTPFRMRLESVVNNESVPQYPGAALVAHADRFNVIVGPPEDALPGYSVTGCFGAASTDDPTICAFTRPGRCG